MNKLKRNIYYVSCFYDINRENWSTFSRTFENYLDCFQNYINIFSKNTIIESENFIDSYEFIVYIDSRHYTKVKNRIESYSNVMNTKIKLISIDNIFMKENIPIWNKLEREREIMSSVDFKNKIQHRLHFPEHFCPEYTIINHSKIDFINYTININLNNKLNNSDNDYYCWTDFGYLNKPELIPNNFIDLKKLDLTKINYTLRNPIDDRDKNPMYTLMNAPEKIMGGFFFGNITNMKIYQNLYHKILNYYQNVLFICDDDQALVLSCYFENTTLFSCICIYDWNFLKKLEIK